MINYFNKANRHYLPKLDDKRRRASKIEEQQQGGEDDSNNDSLIQFPWDDDDFSLCLDTFPSVNWTKKFNAYPTTGSPLRKHWKDESSEDEQEEEDVGSTHLKNSLGSASTASIPQSAQSDPLPEKKSPIKDKKRKKNKLSLFFKKTDNGAFPYKNDTLFLTQEEELEAPPPIKQRGHIEHISPLSNSSLLNDSLMYRSPIPSVRKVPSNSSSIKSKSTCNGYYRGGGSINGESAVSDVASMESWKVVQSPVHGMTSAVVLPRQQYKPTPSHEYYQFQSSSPVFRSGSIAPSSCYIRSGASTPLQLPMNYNQHSVIDHGYNESGYYYNPTSPPSVSPSVTSSYRSVPVPRSADELAYFSNTPSVYSEKRSSYSQFFNPSYHSGHNNKKNRSTTAKRSGSLLSKLVRNIKHHFVKHQAQES